MQMYRTPDADRRKSNAILSFSTKKEQRTRSQSSDLDNNKKKISIVRRTTADSV